MSLVNSTYPFPGREFAMQPGDSITIDLTREGIPHQAYQVVVYAKIATGHNAGVDEDGEMTVSTTIPNGLIERKLYCHFYGQQAWSYNSESIPLPVGCERAVNASLQGPSGTSKVMASVQIVGYSM
ncbi:uncharacterized protein [Montipora foliosa]|uniref:uncharacterized protein n=1 Tax=Montipora foliosa TaxID=591990 RepID=UPI0035F14FD1